MFRIAENFVLLGVVAVSFALYVAQEECPANEEYLLCGSPCPANCTNPDVVPCIDECIEGCFCKSGFLRNENGTCVSADQCRNAKTTACGENEEFLPCGTACPATCQQPARVCIEACTAGCFCKAGFIRDENNKCIAVDKCPADQCFNENEVYDICSASCEPSCSNPEPICTKICMGGCVCAAGLFRNDAGDCVSVDKCPARNGTDPSVLGKYLVVINKILHL